MTCSGIHASTITRPFWQRFSDVFYHSWLLTLDQAVCSKSAQCCECPVDSRQRAVVTSPIDVLLVFFEETVNSRVVETHQAFRRLLVHANSEGLMTDTTLTPRRLASRRRPRSRMQPRRVRLQIEGLEDRVVPSYFPSTANGIHVFEDQLPGSLSSAMTQFVATHTDGTQKELLSQTNQFRAINPNFTVLHYQLGTGQQPYDYIINDQWASDFSYVNQQESWFAHQSYSGEPQSAADLASGRVGNSTGWYQADIANPAWQQYTLNQVFQNMAATGSNGWFADSFTYGIGGAGYDSPIPDALPGHQRRQPRGLARRRHLDHSTGQLGPDHRERVRPAQRDLRHGLPVHPQPRRPRHLLGAQLVRQRQRRPLHRRRASWRASASTPTPTTGRCR